jgi:hypothetical protein
MARHYIWLCSSIPIEVKLTFTQRRKHFRRYGSMLHAENQAEAGMLSISATMIQRLCSSFEGFRESDLVESTEA